MKQKKHYKPKRCERCDQTYKPTSGTQKRCAACRQAHTNEYVAEWMRQDRKDNPDKVRVRDRKWWAKTREARSDQQKAWYHTGKGKAIQQDWQRRNRGRINKRYKERYATDLHFKLSRAVRSAVHGRLKRRVKFDTEVSSLDCLGCTIEELQLYLESKFKPGMTWDNWEPSGWHIDHIKPLADFDLIDEEQMRKACHYTNLQPLWAKDNFSKGAR